MSKKWKHNILLIFPFVVFAAGTIFTAAFFLHTYWQIAFEHISALCETILANVPEAEPQLLAALKEYHSLTEEKLKGNDYLEKDGYRADDFCYDFSPDTVLFPILFFLVTACAFAAAIFLFRRKNRKRIADLTAYLEQVNIGAGGMLVQTQEDEYSHLQDEIYKTVTSLYQTREMAVAAKKNFAENLANIAHQLKTPITSAFLSLQLMEKEVPGTYAEQVRQQLKRLNRLEESLLMLSKIDAGTLPLKREKVDLYTVLNLASDNLNDLLRNNHITVDIPENGCIEFLGDLEWTMEALINLIKNCMEHSKPGGVVHCEYSGNPLYVEIRVWDDGAGFDKEDLPHLFDRFYRGRCAAPDGIGIGLALARSIFELQNGTITARNLQTGGACFEIRIYSH